MRLRYQFQEKFNGEGDLILSLPQQDAQAWRLRKKHERAAILDKLSELIRGTGAAVETSSENENETKENLPSFTGLTKRLYFHIKATGDHGMTDEEGQRMLRINGNSYRPARRSLVKLGLVDKSGFKRKTVSGVLANAWVSIAEPSSLEDFE